jgi:hypothetical protein
METDWDSLKKTGKPTPTAIRSRFRSTKEIHLLMVKRSAIQNYLVKQRPRGSRTAIQTN